MASDGKVIGYDILTSNHSATLSPKIRAAIKNGWEPLGGVSFTLEYYSDGTPRRYTCAQAVIKREKPKDIVTFIAESESPSGVVSPPESIGYCRVSS